MSKYGPLYHYLRSVTGEECSLTFSMIETIIGSQLPPSAHSWEPWWGNENNKHSQRRQCRAWMDAGWKVARGGIDLTSMSVRFIRL